MGGTIATIIGVDCWPVHLILRVTHDVAVSMIRSTEAPLLVLPLGVAAGRRFQRGPAVAQRLRVNDCLRDWRANDPFAAMFGQRADDVNIAYDELRIKQRQTYRHAVLSHKNRRTSGTINAEWATSPSLAEDQNCDTSHPPKCHIRSAPKHPLVLRCTRNACWFCTILRTFGAQIHQPVAAHKRWRSGWIINQSRCQRTVCETAFRLPCGKMRRSKQI